MDDGGYAHAGSWDDRRADGLAEPGDDTTHEAGSDDVEFADVVDSRCGFAEAGAYRWGEALPGQIAQEALYTGRVVRLPFRCAASWS
jgi:hypothetical protein